MEEVDQIVIHTLRQLGCDVEENISSLKEFTTDLVVEGVVRCLQLISPSLELPHHVPPSMSARYRLGSTLAAACVDLGYTDEIGYQTFLYSSEGDLRKVFIFLIEKLPKESEKVVDEPLGNVALISRATAAEISDCLNIPWLPSYCTAFDGKKRGLAVHPFRTCQLKVPLDTTNISPDRRGLFKEYYDNHLPIITKQTFHQQDLTASVFEANTLSVALANEWNKRHLASQLTEQDFKAKKATSLQKKVMEHLAQALHQSELEKLTVVSDLKHLIGSQAEHKTIKGSRFVHSEKLQFTSVDQKVAEPPQLPPEVKVIDTEEEMKSKREAQLALLQTDNEKLSSKLLQLEQLKKQLTVSIQQMQEQASEEQRKVQDTEEMHRVKKCTLALLPDAENNIQKLQTLVEGSSQHLVSLANQWEQHRAQLIDEYRLLKEVCSQRLSETQCKLEEIKELREKIREIGDEARNKDDVYKQLISTYDKLTKDVNRSAYTRRIMEIVGNIKKQKAEIDKVLLDTRTVQKEINQLSGKLERTFTVTDELIFRDAKKDEAVRRAYKHLAALHENCSLLILTVEETGGILREIRDLEDQIEQESQKKVVATLERITSDYRQMQQENATLIAQLKE